MQELLIRAGLNLGYEGSLRLTTLLFSNILLTFDLIRSNVTLNVQENI